MGWHTWSNAELNETIRLAEIFSLEQIARMKGYESRQVISMAFRKNNIRLHKKLHRKMHYGQLLKYQVWEVLTNRELCTPQGIEALRLERFPKAIEEGIKQHYRLITALRSKKFICKSLKVSGFKTTEIASFLGCSPLDVVEWCRDFYAELAWKSREKIIEDAYVDITSRIEQIIHGGMRCWWDCWEISIEKKLKRVK